jgi:hypothetical protein
VFVAALAAFGAAGLAWAVEESDHADHAHATIRITNARLHPEVARATPSDALGWLNYSSRTARIYFDKSVAEKLACAQKPSFQLDGERLVSPRVEGSQFASLCSLEPGEYTYTVGLFTGQGPTPDRELEGRLIIEE